MTKPGQSTGFTFDAQSGQKLSYATAENVCVWVFTPDNKLLNTQTIPQSGKYTIQVSAPKGSTTFNLTLSLQNPQSTQAEPAPTASPKYRASIAIQQQPEPSEVAVSTQRITFESGSTGTSIHGSVTRTQKQRHLMQCGAGQSMSLKIGQGAVNVSIIAPDGSTIGTINDGSKEWQGTLPSDGDYALEVSTPDSSNYTINVEVLEDV
jgi:hypothetical protein